MNGLLSRASRYDFVLAVIPAAFVVALIVGSVASMSLTAAASAASAIGLIAVIDALFLNPPREPTAGPPAG